MRNENYLKFGVAAVILILGVTISCSRNFAVPVTATQNTPTLTSTNTSGITSTFTNTPTNTATSTPAISSTFTNTATVTATNTITNTATITSTNTSTSTPGAATSTFTNTATCTPTNTACANPPLQVSNFQTAGSNVVNPCLTNVIANANGFFGVNPGAAAPVNGTISSTIAAGQGDATLGDSYGVSVYSTWSDAPGDGYPSVQEQCALYSGSTYYVIPAGTTGIKYYLNINTQSVTGGTTAADFELQIGEAATVPISGGGTCYSGCYNNFQQYTEPAGTTTGGWVLITETWATFATGYGEGATEGATGATPFPCSTTVFDDGCNNANVMTLQFMAGSHNNAGNYTSSFQLDDITFY